MGARLPVLRTTKLFLAVLFISACAKPHHLLKSAVNNCVTARVLSNGWHVDIALPVVVFEPSHPLRRAFPEARYFLIGWGERDFYMMEDAGVWKGVKAALPPSPSVLHVVAVETSMAALQWRDSDYVEFAISQTGARAIAQSLAQSLVLDETGEAVVLGEGRVAGRSVFLGDRGNFHLFHMCNHWAAARLKESGLPLNVRLSFTASGLMAAIRRIAPASCPVE